MNKRTLKYPITAIILSLMPLLFGVKVCTISAADINITDFGAVPGDEILDTEAIQDAIDACGSGDRVVVPAGTFMTGTIYLKSNMTLKLSEGAILKGSDDWEDYLHKNGNWNNNNAMIIAEFGSANITIEGPGIIDGNNCTNPNGRLGYRGQMCMTIYQNASNIRISDITIQNFTSWNIYVKEGAQGVTLDNVTILGGADGLHIVLSTDITVTDCDFRNGDDNIAGVSNVNVTILNTRFNSAVNGMRFSGKNVLVRDCEFWGPAEYPLRRSANDVPPTKYSMDAAIWHYAPKTNKTLIPSDNWVVENCTVDSVGQVLRYFYDESKSAKNKGIKTMTFNNLTANTYYPDGAFYVDDILSEEKVRGEMRLIINGGDISSSSTSNAVINMKNFDHLELHDVTLRNNGEMPAIEAINGDTVWLDNVAIDPVSNPNPFDLHYIATYLNTDLKSFDVELHFAIANEETLLPEELEVILNGRKFYTDSSGKIMVSDILEGFYTINLPDEEYQIAKNKTIEISSDSIFTIQLIPVKQLHVEVLDKNDFSPVYLAAVNINGKTLLTGENGMIDFGTIPKDTTLVFSITHEDYLTYNDSAFVNSDTTIQISMYPKLTDIGFKISDSEGPVYSAMVNTGGMTIPTNQQGEAYFYNLPSREEYVYSVSKNGYQPITDTVYIMTDTTFNVSIEKTLSIDAEKTNVVRIYPNPFKEKLTILMSEPGKLELYDIKGRLVHQSIMEAGLNTFSTDDLKPGVFLLKIISKNVIHHYRILK